VFDEQGGQVTSEPPAEQEFGCLELLKALENDDIDGRFG
jgi:hypothetical protein